jgi:hypothetical protein
MSVISKRGMLSTIIFVLIVGTAIVIWGVPRFVHKTASTKGRVTMFLLDDHGSINGLLLSTGDQIHFSPETGEIIGSQVKIGDEVTATGHGGTRTTYGREIHSEQLAFNGQTIVEVHAGPGPGPRPGPKHDGDEPRAPERGPQIEQPVTDPISTAPPAVASTEATARDSQVSATPAPPEIVKLSGTVKTHLINGHGDVDGLVLSSGEQMRFGPRVGHMIISAEQSGSNTINVEGTVVRSDRGVVIKPRYISVGNQTITLGH